MEMLPEVGYCHGIENYSRHLSGRAPGRHPIPFSITFQRLPPDCGWSLTSLFLKLRACTTETEHAKRLWSNTDSVYPLRWITVLYDLTSGNQGFIKSCSVSATPAPYELKKCQGQSGRANYTGQPVFVDPIIYVKPAKTQVNDL